MKKGFVFLLLCAIIGIFIYNGSTINRSCDIGSQTYSGKSNNWKAGITFETENSNQTEFTLCYTGSNMKNVDLIGFDVDGGSFGFHLKDGELNKEGLFEFEAKIPLEDKIKSLEGTVHWNDHSETLTLLKKE
ncbi:hypothetical protein [Alkalihalobacillus sp. TS-13]|uniref:hypothetical protein n=1 Tax=Alkalihalobacillus sp. TS-13 TaxID=2842455 RepID=UPI001C8782B4|nr:hypothetical protein [Alkalihalobacillus sp. TS-13]